MNKEIFELGNYLDDLLNGNISKEALQIKIEEEMKSKKSDYIPLTREEKNKMVRNGLSLDNAVAIFDDYMLKNNLAKTTIRTRKKRMNSFIRYVKSMELEFLDITEHTLIEYLATKNRTSKTRTNSPHLQLLRAFYNFLYADKIIDYNPIVAVVKQELSISKNKKHTCIQVLTNDEIKRILMSFDLSKPLELRTKVIVLLLLDTGITLGELCKVEVEDLLLDKNLVYIKTARNGINRTIEFTNYTSNMIRAYLKVFQLKCGKLLNNTKSDECLNEDAVYKILTRYGDKIGIQLSSKIFRNTYVLHQMRNGKDSYSLQELMGFTTAKALAKYHQEGALVCEQE